MSDFDEIVDSYMPAARYLLLSRAHVEMAVLKARRIEKRCPSCRFSRAPYNVLEIAQVRKVLCIFKRRCIRRGVQQTCSDWEPLEVPEAVLEAA
jgi:hypothetical protein